MYLNKILHHLAQCFILLHVILHFLPNIHKRFCTQITMHYLSQSTMLFEDWSDEDIDYLSSQAIVRNYGSNTEIQKAGEKVNCLSMIKSGTYARHFLH